MRLFWVFISSFIFVVIIIIIIITYNGGTGKIMVAAKSVEIKRYKNVGGG